MKQPQWKCLCLSTLMLSMTASMAPLSALARPHVAIDSTVALDEQISASLAYLAEGNIQQARLLTRQMAWRFPDFSLGHLIYAELESVAAFQDVVISDHLSMPRNVSELLLEAQRRLALDKNATEVDTSAWLSNEHLPGNVLQIGSHLSQLLVADLQASALYQYQVVNQQALLVREHYIGSGEAGSGKRLEGDHKTPLGIYNITGFRSDASLPDLYGAGALTLDYPNALDKFRGRTGYGIWLHGVPPHQRSRTPYSSEGCVTMSNEHLTRLASEIDASSTMVILTDDATPLASDTRASLQSTFRLLFTRYQRAWISGDETQLLSLYSNHDQLLNLLSSGNNGLARVNDTGVISSDATAKGSEPSIAQLRYQEAFAAIKPEQLSIFSHPDVLGDDFNHAAAFVVNVTFGELNEYQITTYWTQAADEQWQVLTETAHGPGL